MAEDNSNASLKEGNKAYAEKVMADLKEVVIDKFLTSLKNLLEETKRFLQITDDIIKVKQIIAKKDKVYKNYTDYINDYISNVYSKKKEGETSKYEDFFVGKRKRNLDEIEFNKMGYGTREAKILTSYKHVVDTFFKKEVRYVIGDNTTGETKIVNVDFSEFLTTTFNYNSFFVKEGAAKQEMENKTGEGSGREIEEELLKLETYINSHKEIYEKLYNNNLGRGKLKEGPAQKNTEYGIRKFSFFKYNNGNNYPKTKQGTLDWSGTAFMYKEDNSKVKYFKYVNNRGVFYENYISILIDYYPNTPGDVEQELYNKIEPDNVNALTVEDKIFNKFQLSIKSSAKNTGFSLGGIYQYIYFAKNLEKNIKNYEENIIKAIKSENYSLVNKDEIIEEVIGKSINSAFDKIQANLKKYSEENKT